MPMEELLAMYGYGSCSQQPLPPPSDAAAVSNSADCSMASSNSSSDAEDDTASAGIPASEDGHLRNGGTGIIANGADTALVHTSRLLRCEHCMTYSVDISAPL